MPDEEDLVYLLETFERLNDRFLDEIRGWDALTGVLLGTIFAIFVLFVDKIGDLTIWPLVLLVIPCLMTIWNLGGRTEYTPEPAKFEAAFQANPLNALANLKDDHKDQVYANSARRDAKRSQFYRALGALAIVCVVAACFKGYNIHDGKEAPVLSIQQGRHGNCACSGQRKPSRRQLYSDSKRKATPGQSKADRARKLRVRFEQGTHKAQNCRRK